MCFLSESVFIRNGKNNKQQQRINTKLWRGNYIKYKKMTSGSIIFIKSPFPCDKNKQQQKSTLHFERAVQTLRP